MEAYDVESDWNAGKIKDPVEAVLRVERIRLEYDPSQPLWPPKTIWAAGGSVLLLLAVPFGWMYFFPIFAFVWGDYARVYEYRRSKGRFVLAGMILATVVGIAANFFSRKLGF